MSFVTIEFAIFLPIIFILYWFVANKNLRIQNLLIVIGSYFFYGLWDWRFLSLIIFSTIVDYTVGLALDVNVRPINRKLVLWISIIVNLGILGVFKYHNWFIDSLYNFSPGLKAVLGYNTLDIILPVGISFYTFQTLSYSIDIYKGNLKPTKDFIAFSAFVSFFPQLVAGPIERATNLLPQFQIKRNFSYPQAVDGLRQILWGLFKKIVIADNCARYANLIFNNSENYSGSTLVLGAILFAFQIYGDFSGYSDIAIGTSRLFGFKLMKNFAFPYFSRDIAEFWRRWHISLSTWFRDYVYIPLGGSRGGIKTKVRNIFIIFLVSGFWHGANWTFIVWGAINALYFLPILLTHNNRKNLGIVAENNYFPSIKELSLMVSTFILTTIAWVFFRAENVTHAFHFLAEVFSSSFFVVPEIFPKMVLFLIMVFILLEWMGRKGEYAIQNLDYKWGGKYGRFSFYYIILLLIFWYSGQEQPFIYFQF